MSGFFPAKHPHSSEYAVPSHHLDEHDRVVEIIADALNREPSVENKVSGDAPGELFASASLQGPGLTIPALDEAPEKRKREYKDMEEKHGGDLHARVDMNTVCLPAIARACRAGC